ncbi:MAG: hypothetical protein EXS09_21135 [Gemmataceae bacterium]|nr:hypothetical protein [Gemmataceae bacterium]
MSTNQTVSRSVVSAQRVRIAADVIRVAAPKAEGTAEEPRIQLIRESGVIRAIDVTCSCGEKIRIVCEY